MSTENEHRAAIRFHWFEPLKTGFHYCWTIGNKRPSVVGKQCLNQLFTGDILETGSFRDIKPGPDCSLPVFNGRHSATKPHMHELGGPAAGHVPSRLASSWNFLGPLLEITEVSNELPAIHLHFTLTQYTPIISRFLNP